MIDFNKQPGQRILELGCGNNPHPQSDCRVDIRPTDYTDFVCSFEDPLPISSDEWDAVYCCFVLEHISWRKVPQFVKECLRVLKPGGTLVLVIPNTEAQMQYTLQTQDWDNASCMLFGDQDYPENSHKAAFSPSSATKLLVDTGFQDIRIHPVGELRTDMLLLCKKPEKVLTVGQTFGGEGPQGLFILDSSPDVRDFTPNVLGSNVNQVETLKSARERERLKEKREKLADIDNTMTETIGAGTGGRSLGLSQPLQIIAPQEPYQEALESNVMVQEGEPFTQLSESILEGSDGVPGDVEIITPQDVGILTVPPELKGGSDYHPESLFDHSYFDGGGKVGGYAREGYRDFTVHEITAQHILDRKPESVLELGCARGYILKRIQDAGVPGAGLEVSKHCYMTRVADRVIHKDLSKTPWFGDEPGHFDLCYSVATLEHIPEIQIPRVLEEMQRVSKRGLHGIDFGDNDDGFDKTHFTLRPKSWWEFMFGKYAPGYPVEIVDKEELERGTFPPEVLAGDGRTKLNIGSCTTMFHHGWTNIDVLDLDGFAQQNGYRYLRHDVTRGLPMYGTGVVDLIYSSHFLEHLTYEEGLKFLRECRRVIRPETGVMRIIVPDAELLIMMMIDRELGQSCCWNSDGLFDFDHINWGCYKAVTPTQKLSALLLDGHKALYDWQTLQAMLEDAGFCATRCKHREGHPQILKETLDLLPCLSLYVEANPRII